MSYNHTFQVRASLQAVANFHAQSSSMAAITPPPVRVQIQHAPVSLGEGDEMAFTLWLGPFPINWLARIEAKSANGFSDRQMRGPFKSWVHRHTFAPIDQENTEVVDEIEYSIQKRYFWGIVGWALSKSLPILFAYRGWKTRRILSQSIPNKIISP